MPEKAWNRCENSQIRYGIRDDKGGMILMMSKFLSCKNSWCAELSAVEWATGISKGKGWNKVVWSSDATGIVDLIIAAKDLMLGTHTRILYRLKREEVGSSFGILDQPIKLRICWLVSLLLTKLTLFLLVLILISFLKT